MAKKLHPWSSKQICYICQQSFTLRNLRKTCKNCNRLVCKFDSAKRKFNGEMMRLCDICRYQSEKSQIQQELLQEKKELDLKYNQIKIKNKQLEEAVSLKKREIDMKLLSEEQLGKQYNQTIDKLNKDIQEYSNINKQFYTKISTITSTVQTRSTLIQNLKQREEKIKEEYNVLENFYRHNKQSVENLRQQLGEIKQSAGQYIDKQSLFRILCTKCYGILFGQGELVRRTISEQNKHPKQKSGACAGCQIY